MRQTTYNRPTTYIVKGGEKKRRENISVRPSHKIAIEKKYGSLSKAIEIIGQQAKENNGAERGDG